MAKIVSFERFFAFHLLLTIISLYANANRHSEAIQRGKELCGFIKNEMYSWSVLLLGCIYENAGLTEQQDSCINIIRHLPEFEEVYGAYMKEKE